MFVVDTNVLIYAADVAAPEHDLCRARLEAWRTGPLPWYLTWPIAYEFLRVSTHPRVFRQPLALAAAWEFLGSLFASAALDVLRPTERHREVAARTLGDLPFLRGNILHDAHTAILMREHGISRIYTRDNDFHRFPFLTVIDPLGPEG